MRDVDLAAGHNGQVGAHDVNAGHLRLVRERSRARDHAFVRDRDVLCGDRRVGVGHGDRGGFRSVAKGDRVHRRDGFVHDDGRVREHDVEVLVRHRAGRPVRGVSPASARRTGPVDCRPRPRHDDGPVAGNEPWMRRGRQLRAFRHGISANGQVSDRKGHVVSEHERRVVADGGVHGEELPARAALDLEPRTVGQLERRQLRERRAVGKTVHAALDVELAGRPRHRVALHVHLARALGIPFHAGGSVKLRDHAERRDIRADKPHLGGLSVRTRYLLDRAGREQQLCKVHLCDLLVMPVEFNVAICRLDLVINQFGRNHVFVFTDDDAAVLEPVHVRAARTVQMNLGALAGVADPA